MMNQRPARSIAAPARAAGGHPLVASGQHPRRQFLRGAAGLGLGGGGLALLAGCTGTAPRPAPAAGRARIGVVSTGPGADMPEFDGLRRGLRELGYVDGQNIAIEYRFARGHQEMIPQFVSELVALKPDVIVAHGLQACLAAKDATTTIPIVFGTGNDPVALGFATSLARPGRNMTGLVHSPPGLNAKRLQLLKDAAPDIARVGVLLRSANGAHPLNLSEMQAGARALGVQVQPIEMHGADQIEASFEAGGAAGAASGVGGERPDGLLALPDALFFEQRARITDLTIKGRLPAIFQEPEFAQGGGLLAYGGNMHENFRRAAAYVDKILKGARPADLPIEQPARFDFVINLKTAAALGLAIPKAVLEQATEVIR